MYSRSIEGNPQAVGIDRTIQVPVRTLTHYEGLPLPEYKSEGAAGMDLLAAIDDDLTLDPNKTVAVPTGIAIEIPTGYEAQVRPRSGLALHHNITVMNSPGTIDSDYRGEIKVLLINLSPVPFTIKRGDRIAQIVFAKYSKVQWIKVEKLEETQRDSGGFGHTGR